MSNRKRRLLRKLANLPVSREERARRAKQRLIAETEQWMTAPRAFLKEDLDRFVHQMAGVLKVPYEYLSPSQPIQVIIDDPLKKQLEDDPCERRYNEQQQVQDVENTTASAEGRVEDGGSNGG
jgi:hypothetical protein